MSEAEATNDVAATDSALAANKDETILGGKPAEGVKDPADAVAADDAGDKGDAPEKVKDSDADDTEEVGAPEKYEDFVVPENMELSPELVEEFVPIAKELDLSQSEAQKLVDFHSKFMDRQQEATENYWSEVMSEWQTKTKSDKEVGGKAFNDSLASAKTALSTFGTPELLEALETTGMGNHPEVIRVLARVGKAIKEDKIMNGATNPSNGPRDPAKILFPNQN